MKEGSATKNRDGQGVQAAQGEPGKWTVWTKRRLKKCSFMSKTQAWEHVGCETLKRDLRQCEAV